MGFETVLILTLASVFGFYMAWNIGANDVANAMGTSVGSKALTLKQAILVAAVFEFAGAFLVGSHVTDTVRKGMIDLSVFTSMEDGVNILMYGMLASLLAAGAWLQVATYFGWPVSTTHSIVGAIVGFGVVAGGASGVAWGKIGQIVMSWVASPLLSGTIGFLVFSGIRRTIINVPDPVRATKRWAPLYVFLVFAILTLVTLFKGLKNLKLDLSLPEALLVASAVGAVASVLGSVLIRRVRVGAVSDDGPSLAPMGGDLRAMVKHVRKIRSMVTPEVQKDVEGIQEDIDGLMEKVRQSEASINTREEYRFVEKVFAYLQILSACFVAFAHGANDVANAIGPFAAVVALARDGSAALEGKTAVPVWILLVGGAGIVVGLSMWGWRVMATIGQKITELTPSRGFAAEFAAATTIVMASRLGIPISTTHTLVGAVLGVGLARGMESLNRRVVRDIVASWVVTLPAGAGLSIVFFFVIKGAFRAFGG
ncbi:inorganic phosphate transporter [Candidatus Poribacteria bacterium]|jgi:inorganic phosphate transporter, PiT family|nr:inorganic phosphate transporter [Candidatus Poribacteria bacterium]MBT5714037.1 inorganic phosphate transporter [Candidatus Poribacteria bacterium]MBT7098360.1 inorganic phosphate transporter [Candidatus Poribacteria bacterium]MBT7807761.1 inorganic phosphate transporter [Candidatus Poribacteria bacterium]